MTGITDGHNIEVGSTPIDRLEEDIATQSELNDVITALSVEATARANADTVLQQNINNLEAAVSNNYVHKTGSMAEVITGVKTFTDTTSFSSNVTINGNLDVNGTTTTVDSQDLNVSDNIIVINNGETSDHVTAGISGWHVDRGVGDAYRVIFDDAVDCLKAGFIGNEKCLATVEYVDSQVGTSSGGLVALGTDNFTGNGTPKVINFTPDVGTRPYSVNITPAQDANEEVGEVYYIKNSGTQFTVYNSGDATTSFDWSVGVVGILPAASGVAGGDLSGTYPDPTVVKIQNQPISTVSPLTGQALIWDGAKWEANTSSGSPGGAAGGDLGGTYPSPSVEKIRGRSISNAAPGDGNVLTWIAATSSWTPQVPVSGGASDLNGLSDVTITSPSSTQAILYNVASSRWENVALQLTYLADVAYGSTPSDGEVLTYVAANNRWENRPATSGSGATLIATGKAAINASGAFVTVSGMLSTDAVTITAHQSGGQIPQSSDAGRFDYAVGPANGGFYVYSEQSFSTEFFYMVAR